MFLRLLTLLLLNPAMLTSLSLSQQGSNLRNAANPSKQKKVEGKQASRGHLLDSLLLAEQLSQPTTPRRLPPLGNLAGSSEEEISRSSSSRPKPEAGPDVQLRHKRQHAFDLQLEEMLFKVGKRWEADLKRKRDEKGKREGEKPPGWQKIWYKRLG